MLRASTACWYHLRSHCFCPFCWLCQFDMHEDRDFILIQVYLSHSEINTRMAIKVVEKEKVSTFSSFSFVEIHMPTCVITFLLQHLYRFYQLSADSTIFLYNRFSHMYLCDDFQVVLQQRFSFFPN